MADALVVLQLDTRFPRVPGDIACPETYSLPMRIEIVPKASGLWYSTGFRLIMRVRGFQQLGLSGSEQSSRFCPSSPSQEAQVADVVSADPEALDITGFVSAVAAADAKVRGPTSHINTRILLLGSKGTFKGDSKKPCL